MNVKRIILASTTAVAALLGQAAIISGRVTTDGTSGIANVPVTDGYTFVTTDADGSYTIDANPDAHYIFPITPSGYEPTVTINGVEYFFIRLDELEEGATADFVLNPVGDDTRFHFFTVADPQPGWESAEYHYNELRKAYLEMHEYALKFHEEDGFRPYCLIAGDVTATHTYTNYYRMISSTPIDIRMMYVPGNHDREYVTDVDQATANYQAVFGPLYHSFNRGGIHFLMLDNMVVKTEGDFEIGMPDYLWKWIEEDLKFVEPGSQVIVVAHVALTNSKKKRKTFAQLYELLKPYNVLAFSGHSHAVQNVGVLEGYPNFEEKNLGTLSGAHWWGPINKCGAPNCYYIITCDHGTVESWKYMPYGRDPEQWQFRLYEPEEFTDNYEYVRPEDPKVCKVNLYDYDAHVKVTWKLDGVDMGDVPRYEDDPKDPWANYCYLYKGEDWVSKCDHLFHCDVPPYGSKVEVTVNDRFGRKYVKTLTLSSVGGIEALAPETSGIARAEIFNMQGQRILEVEGLPETSLLPIAPGAYIMRTVATDGTVATSKFIR